MKEHLNRILKEGLEDVNLDREWSRLLSAILGKDKVAMRYSGKKRLLLSSIKYVAAILVGVCISFLAFYLIDNTDPKSSVQTHEFSTGKGEKSQITLPDGTKIGLNVCTSLVYDINYGLKNRVVYLDGEAYFEVAKNKKIPFTVKAGRVDVTVLGTVFNISAYKEDANLVTTLFSGRVAMRSASSKRQIMLVPNQAAVYEKDKNNMEVISYDESKHAQWRNPYSRFEMISLGEIAKLLERNYNVVFRYDSQRIKELRFTGSFRNDEALSDILTILKTNMAIDYQIRQDTIIIK